MQLHPMARALIIFAHGAGAPSSSAWMRRWTRNLGTIGDVYTFDYPYMAVGKKRPDPLPRLLEAHVAAISDARRAHGQDRPVVLAGKSMGSRIGCHVAAETSIDVQALVCFGYPLVGMNGKVRDAVLLALRTPILFVQGTRDTLCPLAHLAEVRARMTAPNTLITVEDGDHSLAVTKTALRVRGETQTQVDARTLELIRAVRVIAALRGSG